MKSQLKRRMPRTKGDRATIFCCYGIVYTIADKVLGAEVEAIDEILGRLRRIDGVKVTEVRGGVGNIRFPALRLPEVTSVLVPLDSVRAPAALAAAAHRGRIW
jgi:hypothetical protein